MDNSSFFLFKQKLLFFIPFIMLICPSISLAEQTIEHKEFIVHYSVFTTDFIDADTAKNYGIKRSNKRALVNITPQRTLQEKKVGTKAKVSGTAKNLLGNSKKLDFKEIIEGDVVYYIAEISFSNEELFRFKITIQPQDSKENINLEFQKKLYID